MDKRTLVNHRAVMSDHSFNFVADIPTVFHCHHFNLFWDQTIDDALGPELGTVIRTNAARESFYDLLAGLAARLRISEPDEMLQLAQAAFHLAGQGNLTIDATAQGGEVFGDDLHYAVAWKEKYGNVRRRYPADALAAGFAAAAIELSYSARRDSIRCREQECIALDANRCRFVAEVSEPGPLAGPMTRTQVAQAVGPTLEGQFETGAAAILTNLRDMVLSMVGDDRGLIHAFGLFISELPTTYYNRSAYDSLRHLGRTAPEVVSVMHALLREAGHACVFNTFGAIMASPEWEGLVGVPTGEYEDTLTSCLAIARALGMGHWCVHEVEPGTRLVLRTPSTYEATYYASREGRADSPQCFFFQGAAVGLMQLMDRVQWNEKPTFDQAYYQSLFRAGLPYRCEETQCVAKGDPFCEVVVSRQGNSRTFM